MITSHLLAACALIAAMPPAQQLRLFDCSEVLANLERYTGKDTGGVKVVSRLERMLVRLMSKDRQPMMGVANGGTGIVIGADQDTVATMNSLLVQLRRPDLEELRVQCTLVSMPRQVAADCGLAPGQVLPVDEGQAGKVLKAAVAAKGTLRNLPETGGLPLEGFVAGQTPVVARPDGGAAGALGRMCVRVEALPLDENEACFAMQVVQGDLHEDRSRLPSQPVLDGMVRLKVGGGALLMAARGEQATVLWIRFVARKQAAKKADAAPAGKGSEPPLPAGK